MSIRFAFVTLLTSDAYLPGALAIAAALKDVHGPPSSVEYETVCFVTPETVDVSSIRLLRKAFNVVIGVEVIAPPDSDYLTLLGRPDLDTALTKLHVFRLIQYSKVIFLDADVLPLRPLSHLFHLDHEFSAVPDVGWPDIFNSGVMVLSPGENKFEELQGLLNTKGTWDGADQGILNEWRGNNWNRLSFTYNTTPTAIYTYAPAYQRFGSQISIVHFIGPHKPWHSIAHRAPGSSTQSTDAVMEPSTETPASQQRTFSYDSLVNRWYNVYDRHYRSQAADWEPGFQPSKYTSTWNEEGVRQSISMGGVLGLEELRRAALEGMGASGILLPRVHGEGDYRTMPLEGRFDLIRPRTRAERKQETQDSPEISASTAKPSSTSEPSTPLGQTLSLPSGSPVRWATLPTPGVNEIPSAPQARLLSLPPTPLRYVPAPYKLRRDTREVGAQTVPSQFQHQESESSPPTGLWNVPAITPPNAVTPAPTDTYFPKVWDVDQNSSSVSPSSSDTSLTTVEFSPSKQPNASSSPSPVPRPPESLHRQGQYHNIFGEVNGSPTPDPTKVKRIFPWEEAPRHTPVRVFPNEGSLFAAVPHAPVSATPEKKPAFRSPMPSPLVGFPPTLLSHYSSESPLPQKYASKVLRSMPSSSPLGHDDKLSRVETDSHDADVEDKTDSEEETVTKSRRRSSGSGMPTRAPRYRSIGVQTDPRELREEGIQVTTFVPATEVAEKLMLMNRRLKRNWSTPPRTAWPYGVAAVHVPAPSPLFLPILDSPSDLPEDGALNGVGDLNVSSPSSLPVLSSRTPSSPARGLHLSHVRRGSRVWDPARGVEAFKRGSEEVLAKFVKIGSADERA